VVLQQSTGLQPPGATGWSPEQGRKKEKEKKMFELTADEEYLDKKELMLRWTALAESWGTDFLREMLEQVEEQVHLGEEKQ
jgi:hypothetical protein